MGVGFVFFVLDLLTVRSFLVKMKAFSCIVTCILDDLTVIFNSTASVANFITSDDDVLFIFVAFAAVVVSVAVSSI